MTLNEIAQWMLDREYAILANGQFCLTAKFHTDLKTTATATATVAQKIVAINTEEHRKEVWNKFVEDTDIPWRVQNSSGGVYTVRQYSKLAAKKLVSIINDEAIDYQRLVDSTKHYYKTVTFKKLLSNYINEDIWKDEYEQYKKQAQHTIFDGGSKWED